MENKIIEISIPGIVEHEMLVKRLLKIIQEEPQKFNPDVKITSVYGSFFCIWNGGRVLKEDGGTSYTTPAKVKELVKTYNKLGIKVRYTFTNLYIDEEMTHDVVGNMILRATREVGTLKNDINISNELFRNYIETKYPEFPTVYSTTMCLKDIDLINEYSKDHLVVPDYTINNDFEKLSKLSHPENIELLTGETCIDDCPFRKRHYESYSNFVCKKGSDHMNCMHGDKCRLGYYQTVNIRKRNIKIDAMREKYLPLGFNKFKITGRGDTVFTFVENLVLILVKPEFQNDVRLKLLTYFFNMENHS